MLSQCSTIQTAAAQSLRNLEEKQNPVFIALLPLASTDHHATNLEAIAQKNLHVMYQRLTNRHRMPLEILPTFDNCVNHLVITGEISPTQLMYKAGEIGKVRLLAFPHTDPVGQDEGHRIFTVWAANAQNIVGETYRFMSKSRTASGFPGLHTLSSTELVTAMQQTILMTPQTPQAPPKAKKTAAQLPVAAASYQQQQHNGNGYRGTPSTRSAPAAAPSPTTSATVSFKGRPVVPHPQCSATSYCRKCDVFGHHVIWCDAPVRPDMPPSGFIKVHAMNRPRKSSRTRVAPLRIAAAAPILVAAAPQLDALGLPKTTAYLDTGASTTVLDNAALLDDARPVEPQLIGGVVSGSHIVTTHEGILHVCKDISVNALAANETNVNVISIGAMLNENDALSFLIPAALRGEHTALVIDSTTNEILLSSK